MNCFTDNSTILPDHSLNLMYCLTIIFKSGIVQTKGWTPGIHLAPGQDLWGRVDVPASHFAFVSIKVMDQLFVGECGGFRIVRCVNIYMGNRSKDSRYGDFTDVNSRYLRDMLRLVELMKLQQVPTLDRNLGENLFA